MMPFKNISAQENETLLKFPAYVSLLAPDSDGKLDEAEKKLAIKFSHIKTYSSDPLLTEFYKEADLVFEKNIDELDKSLPVIKAQREETIKKELVNLEKIVLKLGEEYASVMHRSMKSFKEHVS
ncbi:MAG: hypothetical protein ABIS74_04185, partial [Ferruginibacter sp.]